MSSSDYLVIADDDKSPNIQVKPAKKKKDSWFQRRYGVNLSSAGKSNPKIVMVAVVRDIEQMTKEEQFISLSRIEACRNQLKFVYPQVAEGKDYNEHVIESWITLYNAVKDFGNVVYIAHPDVISTDSVIVNSVMRSGVGLGVATMILQPVGAVEENDPFESL